jgi:SAM-dependent methyltransferase
MHKDRFWELGGCDEEHGHWGQQGIEVACKAWLSGGRLVVNKNTWFAHWFRGGGVPEGHKAGFPYHLSQKQVNKARKRSRELWIDGKWDKAVRPFQWMVDKFNPPGWHDMTIIYYTDGQIKEPIKSRVKDNLKDSGFPVVEVSNEGKERSHLQLFKNILKGTEYAKTKYVAMGEHDCLYPKEHFSFVPKKDDTFYYNTNNWFLTYKNGVYHQPYKIRRALSGLVCNRELLISAVKKRIKFLEEGGVLERGIPGACEFGIVDDYKSEDFSTKEPYIDIRHGKNFSGFRKGKNRTKNLHPWGVFHKVPEGKWYQEATINGVVMPTRRKNDTNEKRWKKFLEPLIEKGEGRFTDLGCNAGFYCRKMSDLGYLAEGVERNPEFIAHNRYWEREEPKGVRLVEGDITEYTPWTSKYTLMANIHYWLTPEQNSELEKKLKAKSLYVVLIGRYKTLDRHASPCTLEYLQELFKDWEEVKVIHDKKHFSVMFKNKYLVEKDVDDITFYQQFIKSKKFLPSFNEYIDKTLAGEKFDRAKSDYADYLRWRQFRSVGTLLRRHTKLIQSMKKDGIREPLVIGRTIDGKYDENRLYDGDHRLIIAKKLGINKIICLKN